MRCSDPGMPRVPCNASFCVRARIALLMRALFCCCQSVETPGQLRSPCVSDRLAPLLTMCSRNREVMTFTRSACRWAPRLDHVRCSSANPDARNGRYRDFASARRRARTARHRIRAAATAASLRSVLEVDALAAGEGGGISGTCEAFEWHYSLESRRSSQLDFGSQVIANEKSSGRKS